MVTVKYRVGCSVIAAQYQAMELRHLKSFVAVAEERHFRRAAERLGIAQPPLSMQIQALERELETVLFRRSRRSVELTEAGQQFLIECREILAGIDRAVSTAKRVGRGEQGRLEVGLTGSSSFNSIVPRTIRSFGNRYPDVELALTERNTELLLEAVQARRVDVAFLRPPVIHGKDTVVEVILEEEMLIALPAGHRLSREAALPLSALRGETFLLRPRTIGLNPNDSVFAALRKAGVSRIVSRQAAPQMSSMLNLVAAGLGISILPASMGHMLPGEVVYLPITGPIVPRAALAFAYCQGELSIVVRNFLGLIREEAGRVAAGRPEPAVKQFRKTQGARGPEP